MKLIQLNTWSCKLPTEIVRLLKEEKPDIACFQEVVTARTGGKIFDTIDTITAEYPFEHQYNTPLVEFNFMHGTATRGNMIASNIEMAETNQIWTRGELFKDFDYLDSGGYNVGRNIAHAEVKTPSGIVHILTLHGYHIKEHKNGNEDTLNACKQLIDYAASLEGPVVITGDFNLSPNSESIQLVNQHFRNLTVESGLETTRNHLTAKTEVCDYIFVNDLVKVDSFRMSDLIVSDHGALILEFR